MRQLGNVSNVVLLFQPSNLKRGLSVGMELLNLHKVHVREEEIMIGMNYGMEHGVTMINLKNHKI